MNDGEKVVMCKDQVFHVFWIPWFIFSQWPVGASDYVPLLDVPRKKLTKHPLRRTDPAIHLLVLAPPDYRDCMTRTCFLSSLLFSFLCPTNAVKTD